MQGPVAVLLTCGLVLMAGLCVAAWAFRRAPADAALTAGTVAVGLAYGAVHLLGWLGWLTPGALMGTVAALALPPIGLTLGTRRGRGHLRETAAALGRFAREGLAVPWRARSLSLLGVVAVLGLAGWTAWLAYLAPSSAWDGVMYHEPMVGFALQNRGFSPIEMQSADRMLAPVDGYPRLSENLMLFLVAAWDRRLIDLVPSLLLPLLLVATYVATRRFVASRLTALGFACSFVLLPGIVLQLRSTFVDVGFATFAAASLAFVCRARPRARELWMAGLALGLLASAKVTGFVVAPLVGVVGLTLAVREAARSRRWGLLGHALGAMALVVALAGPTYARNWVAHDNPLWPGRVQVEALGIDWAGPLDITNMNVPAERALEWFFGPPIPDEQFHDTKDNGYGNVPPFVVPPLALLGLLLAGRRTLTGPDRTRAAILLAVTLPLLATFALTPARHWARLNFHVVIACFLLAAYFAGRRGRRLLAEGAAAAMIVGALMTLHWSEPAWDVDLERMARLRALSPVERAVQRDEVFTLMPTETARARERELGPGDVLVFERFGWAGLFFNERFDNRVEHIDPRAHRGDAWLAEARRRGAEWVVVRHRSPLVARLRESDAWEEVGPVDATAHPALAFRRTSMR